MLHRFVAATLGLTAFVIVIVAGLRLGNSPALTLSRALTAMVLFFAAGWVVGYLAERVIRENALEVRQRLAVEKENAKSELKGLQGSGDETRA